MWIPLTFLVLVVFHTVSSEKSNTILQNVASEDTNNTLKSPEAKYSGHGYRYGNEFGGGDRDHGYGYGQSHGHGGYHGRGGHGHFTGHVENHTPIHIPYIDRNGCRFPGDIVCDPMAADPPVTYGYCILSDENKNLWKKPTMEIIAADCVPAGTRVLTDFCNDNERLLKAAGLIKDKNPHKAYYHQKKYAVSLNPCILVM